MPHSTATIDSAVIGFTGYASPLEPAWPSTHRSLLPIAGKAVIVHLIEQLATAGIKHLRIAGSVQQFAVQARVGTGQEWGLTVRYSDLHGADLFAQTLIERGSCLYLLGDQLLDVRTALDLLPYCDPISSKPKYCEIPAYWTLSVQGSARMELVNAAFGAAAQLKTTRDFHHCNRVASSGKTAGFVLPGYALSEQINVGWDTYIHPGAHIEEGVTIGAQCHIGSNVSLSAGCAIGDGSVISPGARLHNVSVLPNCYVGSQAALRDAIITPRIIFDLDGNHWPIDDPSVIARSRSNREAVTGLPEESLSQVEQARSHRQANYLNKPGVIQRFFRG